MVKGGGGLCNGGLPNAPLKSNGIIKRKYRIKNNKILH